MDIGRAGEGGSAPLEPVPLDLVARRVEDLDGVSAHHAMTGLAVGSQASEADLTGERRVARLVAEAPDLVMEGGSPDVRVIGEAKRQVVAIGLEGIRG